MGSVGSPRAWAPYDTYRDCSQGICSIYCPQWCYIIFPPPPPLGNDDGSSGTTFSPLIIAIIGILASAFLLVSYYTIVTRYCRRRRSRNVASTEFATHHDEMAHDQWQQQQIANAGLDDALIKSITVFKYKKGDGLVEGTECAVCLNEFQENESLRLLPKCCHAFHLPCIDTWLKSHSNCPICRANVNPAIPVPVSAPSTQTSSTINISNSLEIQRQNDLVFVAEDHERTSYQQVVSVSNVFDLENAETRNGLIGDQEGVRQFRRSISLGTFSCQRNLLVADILKMNEDDNEDHLKKGNDSQSGIGYGSSKWIPRDWDLVARGTTTPAAVKRSFSTGRFTFSKQDKGKNHIIPS
ncbi:hypothetical protein ACH5RR_000548 [Cinchona calisaya]|uniref:RING-type E3 ubiquitin transferase n=1 Tax=Cinchona calisaya TaxID=153742 RepID=A0ABD3B0W9_9GENT